MIRGYKKYFLLAGCIFTVVLQLICSKYMQLEKMLLFVTSLFYFVLFISILESVYYLYRKIECKRNFYMLFVSISGIFMLVTMLLGLNGYINNDSIYNVFCISFIIFLICRCRVMIIDNSQNNN